MSTPIVGLSPRGSAADIPRSISRQLVELAVRNGVHGRAVRNAAVLAHPEVLARCRDLPELAVE